MTIPDTVLAISGIDLTPYSVRGIVQTMEPIGAAARMRRTINGELDDVSDPAFRKYRSTVTFRDQQVPAFTGIWPGKLVIVDCIPEFAHLTAAGTPERTVVPGSSRVEGDFTFYRVRLEMRVASWKYDRNEWGALTGAELVLEEI